MVGESEIVDKGRGMWAGKEVKEGTKETNGGGGGREERKNLTENIKKN